MKNILVTEGGVDLHTHTTASDGQNSAEELIALAREVGLEGVGITDHDTISGVVDALEITNGGNFLVVPGIEISCETMRGTCHILGYFIDPHSPFLREPLDYLRRRRRRRAEEIVSRLEGMGIRIEIPEDVAGRSIGRPHIARALQEAGYVPDTEEAFRSYLSVGQAAYIPSPRLKPVEAIELILKSGGVPILAHPHTFGDEVMIGVFAKQGLMGLEGYYAFYDDSTRSYWAGVAERYGLLLTGGSDFHGDFRKDRPLGMVRLAREMVERLRDARLRVF